MKLRLTLALVAVATLAPLAAHAQNGCVNSPENPTALLAVIGAGAAAISRRKRS